MFCVAVTGRILARIWEQIEASDFPHHLLATQVHYTEHLAFHRPIKPGASLTITGEIAAILPHRVGAHVAIRLDAADKDGWPVFTEHVGALLRGVKCTGEGKGSEALPPTPKPSTQKPPIWEAAVPVDPLRPFIYDGCTGISFHIHTSRQFARQVGLPDIILHGTATLALAVRELVNREAAGNPLLLQSLQCRFRAMVLPNTEIRVQLTGKTPTEEGVDLNFAVLNQDGRRAISKGYAFLKKES
jgi:acyl dehydratase